MLKIKDNVDLKELEKFGFKKKQMLYMGKLIDIYELENGFTILSHTRKFMFIDYAYDILFDLIQANLVEKVEG